jgi:DMSO reductase anchor subunit
VSAGDSYYGQPVIKEPTWTWEIPVYFFTGGLAGASAGLAYLSELDGNRALARRAWLVSLGAVGASPVFLISDLGKPARFFNMLRVFKVTSPMSVGSWILTGSGLTTALAAANELTGLFGGAARVAKPAAALLGLPLSTYTAALVSNTAVPAWQEARATLPFVFASGAAASAGALAVATTPPKHAGAARRLAVGAGAAEALTNELMRRRLGFHGEVFEEGATHVIDNVSRVCVTAGAGLIAARAAQSRAAAIAGGALLAAGALAARWSVFKAGFRSAADPKYVVKPQRERIDSGRRRGAARSESRVAAADARLGSPATSDAR